MAEDGNGNAFEIIRKYSKSLSADRIDALHGRDDKDSIYNEEGDILMSSMEVIEITSSGKTDVNGMFCFLLLAVLNI